MLCQVLGDSSMGPGMSRRPPLMHCATTLHPCSCFVNVRFLFMSMKRPAIELDRPTCTTWLQTCLVALVVEGLLQQPVVLLMTGVMGDFVEEGADLLFEALY